MRIATKKKATIAQPDKNSKRSKRRAKRGFISLSQSSRKHRRAIARQERSATIGADHGGNGGQLHKAGEHYAPDPGRLKKEKSFLQHAGGSIKYHTS